MTDPEIQRLKARFQAKLRTSRFIPEIKARTGKLTGSGTIDPDPKVYDASGNLITNKTWVRIGATGANPAGRSTVPVWNFAVKTIRADAPVILVEGENGDLYIDRADEQAADTAGIPSSFFAPDDAPPELSTTVIPQANIFDLQPYHGGAGILRARPGWLPNGTYWYDDALTDALDVTTYVTATSGQTAYVVAGIDLETNAWHVGTTEDRGVLIAPGSYIDIQTELGTWTNVLAIAATPMANGSTDFANADIVDLRTWGSGGVQSAASTSILGGVLLDENPASGEPIVVAVPQALQDANAVLAGPVSGADAKATFRALAKVDLPNNGFLSGWIVDYPAQIPAGKDAFIVGPIQVTSGSLDVQGDLYIL